MTEVGEGIFAAITRFFNATWLFAAVLEVRFESGIDIYDLDDTGAATLVPAAGVPHWGRAREYAGCYVRDGAGVTDVTIKVRWRQLGFDGNARLRGESSDGLIVIEGDVPIAGERGDHTATFHLTHRPNVVKNYGNGVNFRWTLTAGGQVHSITGPGSLKLYFVDAPPRPVGWGYSRHYLRAIHWATRWAEGRTGGAVLTALWDQFSTGAEARVPHATGLVYWKTNNPVQTLTGALQPGNDARDRGWSCRAIAHLFMECLALHAIACEEVVINTSPGTGAFLVMNWRLTPVPRNAAVVALGGNYYGGSWVGIADAPLNRVVTSNGVARTWTVDCEKRPGVPAQGQLRAPLCFSNHWIVRTNGQLHDTSYGLRHADDLTVYAGASLAGWLLGVQADTYQRGILWWARTEACRAWVTTPLGAPRALVPSAGTYRN